MERGLWALGDPTGAPIPLSPMGRSSQGMDWGESHSGHPVAPWQVAGDSEPLSATAVPTKGHRAANGSKGHSPKRWVSKAAEREGGRNAAGGFPNPDVAERARRAEPERELGWGRSTDPPPVPPPVAPHRSRAGIGAVRAESAIGAAARRAEPAALGRGSDRGETRNRNPRPAERRTGADPEGRSEPRNASRGPLKVTQLPAKPRTAPPLSRRPRQPTPKPGLKIPRVAPVGPLGAAPCGWLGGGGGWHAVLTGCHLRK